MPTRKQDVGFEAFKVGIVERLDGGLLHGSVHAFGLTISPRMLWLGELVHDAVLIADAIKDMGAETPPGRPIAVLWQVCKGHSIVGQDRMDGIWEGANDAAEEVGSVHLADVIPELDVGELGHAIDGQEHVEFALSKAQFTDVDMDEADCGLGGLAALGSLVWVWGQTRYTVACQTAVQAGSG
jgi:hypothetical protein